MVYMELLGTNVDIFQKEHYSFFSMMMDETQGVQKLFVCACKSSFKGLNNIFRALGISGDMLKSLSGVESRNLAAIAEEWNKTVLQF